MSAFIVAGYLLTLIGIGWLSKRRGVSSAEEYFLANRSLGTFVLFMALFGTNVTAFTLLGITGRAYHAGIGIFGFFGAIATFTVPLLFVLFGYPIWKFGRQHGYMTPARMFADRWDSPAVGYTVFALLFLYTVPYLVIGIMGGGIAVESLSGGRVTYQAGAALVMAVTVTYTFLGGMRATAWTNCLQSLLFMAFLLALCYATAVALGGPRTLHERVLVEAPHLLRKEHPMLAPGFWMTGIFVGVTSVIAFPHVFMRLLAAKSAGSLRRSIYLYPVALIMLFLPVTLLGVWGAIAFPGLEGRESDSILPMLAAAHLPWWAAGLGLAAILAAIMSSLDAQLLTLAAMTSVDLRQSHRPNPSTRMGRVLVVTLALVAYTVALARPEAIYNVSIYAFSGYSLIVPIMAAAFFWPRSTAPAILLSTLAGHGLLALYYAPIGAQAWLPQLGVFPVALCLAVQCAVLVGVSMLTAQPSQGALSKFREPFGRLPQAPDGGTISP